VAAGRRRHGEVVPLHAGECVDEARVKCPASGKALRSSAPSAGWLSHTAIADSVLLLRSSNVPACRRLGAELKAMLESSSLGSSGTAVELPRPLAAPRSADKLLEWEARLPGPPDTPYAGGVFYLDLHFSAGYPFKPPRVKFLTPCFHPNISSRGEICLNVLKEEWSPLLTISTVLLCISALLSFPNSEDPLNSAAAEIAVQRPAEFRRVAREWTRRHASGAGPHRR